MKDGSACVMWRGAAERVRLDGVAALAALIKALEPSQALALGALRADLPDKVHHDEEEVAQWRGAARHHRPHRRQYHLSRRAASVRAAGLRQQGHVDRCCGRT